MNYYGSIDIGGTKVRMGLITADGTIAFHKMILTPVEKPWGEILTYINKSFETMLREAMVTYTQIYGIGIGCPGTFDLKREVISFAPNLKWRNIPIKSHCELLFPVPIWFENDTNLSTLGVAHFGEGRGIDNIIGMFIGTGIGGGIIIDKKLYVGSSGSAGEIGHIIIQEHGPRCSCGSRGCLEAVASTTAIYKRIRRMYARLGKTSPLYTHFASSKNRTYAVAQAYNSGEPAAVKVVDSACHSIGTTLVNLIHILAPDMIVLGGGLYELIGTAIIEKAASIIRKTAMPGTCEQVKVIGTALGENAPLLGGAALVKMNLFTV
jgi:glucokinase